MPSPRTPLLEAPEAIVVSPIASSASSDNKRKITPSPEVSASKKIVLISPQGLVPDIDRSTIQLSDLPVFAHSRGFLPPGEAAIDRRYPLQVRHARPESDGRSESRAQVTPSRHIILPFNLQKNRKEYNRANTSLLMDLFPGTYMVDYGDYYFVFHLHTLPPKPWPLTVAGIASYLTTDLNEEGPIAPIKRSSRSRIQISPEVNCRFLKEKVDETVFAPIREFFDANRISITEIQYWGNFVVIVLEDRDTDLNKVPRSVGCWCNCFYLYEDEMGRPQDFPSLRIQPPTQDVVDNSHYDILRPGIMLSSGKHTSQDTEILTSSGLLLKDSLGNQYMTVASHGFPFGDEVFHPRTGHREIGQIAKEIPHTNISLVKLHNGQQFTNETFTNTLTERPPIQLQQLARAGEAQIGSSIYMDNPFTGYVEGTCGPHGITRRTGSNNADQPEQEWVKTRWHCLGQGSSTRIADGSCGSAIWNDQDMVIGFFQYAPRSGFFRDWCMSISAEEVIDGGYSLI